jgi:hypothetical protein
MLTAKLHHSDCKSTVRSSHDGRHQCDISSAPETHKRYQQDESVTEIPFVKDLLITLSVVGQFTIGRDDAGNSLKHYVFDMRSRTRPYFNITSA